MRLLADENLPKSIVQFLRDLGHDVLWARSDCAGFADRAILERAEADCRIILTLDKDFVRLVQERPDRIRRSGVILFRVHPSVRRTLEPIVARTIGADFAWAGHLWIVTPDGIQGGPTGGPVPVS